LGNGCCFNFCGYLDTVSNSSNQVGTPICCGYRECGDSENNNFKCFNANTIDKENTNCIATSFNLSEISKSMLQNSDDCFLITENCNISQEQATQIKRDVYQVPLSDNNFYVVLQRVLSNYVSITGIYFNGLQSIAGHFLNIGLTEDTILQVLLWITNHLNPTLTGGEAEKNIKLLCVTTMNFLRMSASPKELKMLRKALRPLASTDVQIANILLFDSLKGFFVEDWIAPEYLVLIFHNFFELGDRFSPSFHASIIKKAVNFLTETKYVDVISG
jgi:hypothetical protein